MITEDLLGATLRSYCDEFLIHAVDVEGKASGIEEELSLFVRKLGKNSCDLCRRRWRF